MRLRLVLAIGASILACVSGAQTLERVTIASGGGSGQGATAKLDWTLGESATANFQNSAHIISQGFQQLYFNSSTGIGPGGQQLTTKVFPVPCQQRLNINTILPTGGSAVFQLYNSLGLRVMEGKIFNEATAINVSELPEGEYMLIVSENNKIANFKIVKSK